MGSDDEIKKTCFCAAWLLAILNRGFNLEHFSQFKVIRDIEGSGGNIDWVLGYLIAEVAHMNLSEDKMHGSYALRFLLIAIIILIMIYCWNKGVNVKNHTPPNSIPSTWFGLGTSKKENNHKYKYQQLNSRRNGNL